MFKHKERKCYSCGNGIMQLTSARRKLGYKCFRELITDVEHELLTCNNCGDFLVDNKEAKRLDVDLEEIYKDNLRRFAKSDADKICKTLKINLPWLFKVLRLPKNYFDQFYNHDQVPSVELVILLYLLSKDPETRMKEIDEFWEGK